MNIFLKRLLSMLSGLALAGACLAGDINHGGLEPVPEPPDLPDPLESGERIEPEVTIVQKEDRVVHEYRVNGQLYMVKIVPAVGPSYYLMDKNGDGRLESRTDDIYNPTVVPQWVIFRW